MRFRRETKIADPSPRAMANASGAISSHSMIYGVLKLTVTVGQDVFESGLRADIVIVAVEACEVAYDANIFIYSAVIIVVVVIVIAVAIFFRFALRRSHIFQLQLI